MNLYVGAAQVQKLYKGNILVWSKPESVSTLSLDDEEEMEEIDDEEVK